MFVPKIHPATREIDEEDPMELVANPITGDPELMLDCLLSEFASVGYTPEQLEAMMRDPEYPVLRQLHEHFGAAEVSRRIDELCSSEVTLRVTEEIDDVVDEEPELVQLTLRTLGG